MYNIGVAAKSYSKFLQGLQQDLFQLAHVDRFVHYFQ